MRFSKNNALNTKAEAFIAAYKKVKTFSLELDEYNANYLNKYIDKIEYNTYLACNLVEGLELNNFSSIFDIGGGIGFNAAFFSFIGFKNVMYFDVDSVSTKDAKKINDALKFKNIDYYTDSIEGLIKFDLSNSLVCSRDVIEHIYDLPAFFEITKPAKLNRHNTAAVLNSTFRKNEFKAIHNRAEFHGQKIEVIKKRDSKKAYFKTREEIISTYLPEKTKKEVSKLASETCGLIKRDIQTYILEGVLPEHHQKVLHSNTCDPLTGNWAERTLSFADYQTLAEDHKLKFRLLKYNTFNGGAFKKLTLETINFLLKLTKKETLCPSFTIEY